MLEKFTYSKNGVDFIMHADTNSGKFKYVAKEYLGNGHYRYFYSQEEYQAYLDNQNAYNDAYQNTEDALNYAQDSFDQAGNKASDFASNIGKKIGSAANSAYNTNKEAADKAGNFVSALGSMAGEQVKKHTQSVSGVVNAGSDFFKSLFN